MDKKIKTEIALGIIVIIAVIVGMAIWFSGKQRAEAPTQDGIMRVCTMEAKLCSDGKTYVSRTGPNCEFAPCPGEGQSQMANPAAVYCEKNGGKLEIRTGADGGQTGFCVFGNGSECEEWQYYRDECIPGDMPLEDETANWQTYRNEKYGFEFQYPKDWKIEQQLVSEDEPELGISINVGENIIVSNLTIQEGLRNGSDPLAEPNGMDPLSQGDAMIAGQKARIYNNGQVYVVAKNSYQYFLQLFDETKPGKETLQKIVDTFKFIN